MTVATDPQPQPENAKKSSSQKDLRRFDSLDIESGKVRNSPLHHLAGGGDGGSKDGEGWKTVMLLTFQAIGIVYGDIGTSPLYALPGIFPAGINHNDDLLGALSLIFYTITLIALIKYVFIVLRANDNGEGGTFAMYSLICRYAKVGFIPNQESEDRDVSAYEPANARRSKRASNVKTTLENSLFAKYVLLFAAMLGTSMVIGDGIITPCISVTSAVSGLKKATSHITDDVIVWVSVGILIFLFMFQKFGTDKVGYCFAPVLLIWFGFIAGIGLYNFIVYDPWVIRALNPKYIIDYFRRNKKDAWLSLGGVVLCITGCEALFADVGHFSVRAIQISMCGVVYPSIICAYLGQVSFLREHNDLVSDVFFASIPEKVYWPQFVVAVLAAIIASQALISGTFSIIQQSLSLGCFPRVKVVHTSTKHPGQVYIPEMNYLLMVACVLLTLGFRTSADMGNAYGIVVVFVMTLTSLFLVLIMILIWKTNFMLVTLYALLFLSIELFYLSSVLSKFTQGGYLPLTFALLLMAIMYVWNHVYRKKYYYELENKIAPEDLKEIIQDTTNSHRLKGLAFFYSDLVHGIPPIFKHYVNNVPAIHSVLVFVSFKFLPINKVPLDERFLFREVQPQELRVFRCVVRFGYKDNTNEEGTTSLEEMMYEKLKEFILERGGGRGVGDVDEAWQSGVVHLVGEEDVVAVKGAGVFKRIVVNYAYNFMKRNLRQTDDRLYDIPHQKMLKVGMVVEL